MAHKYLYSGKWMDFRRQYMLTEKNKGPRFEGDDEDYTNDNLNYEFEAARWELKPRYLKEFFGYDVRKQALTCFNCSDERTSWCDREWEFAQRHPEGGVACVVCFHHYSDEEYKSLTDEGDRELKEQIQKHNRN